MVFWLKNQNRTVSHFNADEVRKEYNDWDFSEEGRLRQCDRMKTLSQKNKSEIVICDFVAPTEQIRNRFDADYIIFMDTILESRFVDTNRVFERPLKYNCVINNLDYVLDDVMEKILCLVTPKIIKAKR